MARESTPGGKTRRTAEEAAQAGGDPRRAQLLDGVADYVLDHGVAGLSLRPLADAVGTSTRTLRSMFGNADELVDQALAAVRVRQLDRYFDFGERMSGVAFTKALEQFWRWQSSPQNEPFLRLFFETYGLALQDPARFAGFLDEAVADWLAMASQVLVAAGVPARQRKPLATLIVDTVRGLLLDLVTTSDRPRVDAAFREFVKMLDARLRN